MSQIENNSNNSNENNTPNKINAINNISNSSNSTSNLTSSSTTTHYRGKNININFMKEMFKKNGILYIAILFAILAIGLLLAFSAKGQSVKVYDQSGYKVNRYDYDSEVAIFDFENFAFFIALMICVIPPVLSITLFSWIYKRKKVDFIASMPLNKRTICISNTLLGVAFIFVSSILYVSSTAIGAALSGKLFFAKQFIDVFLYSLLAMLFIFGICNLAMSKAGNVVTQLILIGLMLFLIPTGVRVYQYELEVYSSSSYRIEGDDGLYSSFDREFKTNYLPIPLNTIYGEKDDFISPFKIGETLIYIVVIYGLTQFLFEHRNMEENQESFKSTVLHEIVKGSTIVIILAGMFASALDKDLSIALVLLFIIISIVYFVIYDFITAKKVKISITVISLICTYVASFVFGFIYWDFDENFYGFNRTTDVSSIESIIISSDIEIKDSGFIEEFMDTVFSEDALRDDYYENEYEYLYDGDNEANIKEDNEEESDEDVSADVDENEINDKYVIAREDKTYYNQTISVWYKIKLKSGEVLEEKYLVVNEKYFDKTFKAYVDKMQDSIIEKIEKNTDFWQKVVPPGNLKSVDKSEVISALRKIEKPTKLVTMFKLYSSVTYGKTSYCGFYLKGLEVHFVEF